MKVEHYENGSITTYNEEETIFIRSLDKVAQKNIYRGLATPYDYGYKAKVGRVTLDEDEEEHKNIAEEYNRIREALAEYNKKLELYDRFESNFAGYVLFDKKADESIFKIWKSIQEWTTVEDEDTSSDNKVCLITYFEEYWYMWLQHILNEDYKYMSLTQMVWESWLER